MIVLKPSNKPDVNFCSRQKEIESLGKWCDVAEAR